MMSEIRETTETIRTFEMSEPTDADDEGKLRFTVTAELRTDPNSEPYARLWLDDPYGVGGELTICFGSRYGEDDEEIDYAPRVEALMTAAMAFLRTAAPAQHEGDGDGCE